MSILRPMTAFENEIMAQPDEVEIERLTQSVSRLRRHFAGNLYPSVDLRRERIRAVIGMMHRYRSQIADALAADFGSHPVGASDFIETFGPIGRAEYALANLDAWMADEQRDADRALFGDADVSMRPSPKGVIGNIVPWNFPFDIAVGPLVDMFAAGNSVIIKPSDYTPACGELLKEMVRTNLDTDVVDVVVGGLTLARAFSDQPWDHLLYTGSQNVGREVMRAASANLVPVTLELGGKCPAIMLPSSADAKAAEAVVGMKLIKNGQMCISVDHCFVHRPEVDAFASEIARYMHATLPNYAASEDCTGIISDRHLQRLRAMLAEAREAGCRIVETETAPSVDFERRRMPFTLVIDPPGDLTMMREEIFGPILPIIPYDDLDELTRYASSGDRPLGVYIFALDPDDQRAHHIIKFMPSGGAVINGCAVQGGVPSLGFGGSGASGMGRHHGIDGFREFSNMRGIVVRRTYDEIQAFCPPYARAASFLGAATLD